MGRVTVDLVKGVLMTQPVDTLHAEDVNTGDRLGYCSGSGPELCAYLDELDGQIAGAYRVKAWSSKVDGKRGNKPISDKPFVWVLMGRSGAPAPPPTTAPSPAPHLPAAGPSLNGSDHRELGRLSALVESLTAQVDAYRAEVNDLRDELNELEAENEQLSGAAAAPVLRWWETPDMGREILEVVKPISKALSARLFGPGSAAPGSPQPPPAQVNAAEWNEKERALVAAWRNFTAADPETAAMYEAGLFDKFGTPPPQQPQQPEPDGK